MANCLELFHPGFCGPTLYDWDACIRNPWGNSFLDIPHRTEAKVTEAVWKPKAPNGNRNRGLRGRAKRPWTTWRFVRQHFGGAIVSWEFRKKKGDLMGDIGSCCSGVYIFCFGRRVRVWKGSRMNFPIHITNHFLLKHFRQKWLLFFLRSVYTPNKLTFFLRSLSQGFSESPGL